MQGTQSCYPLFSTMLEFDDIKFFLLHNDMDIWAVEEQDNTILVFVREHFRMKDIHNIKRHFPHREFMLKFLTKAE